MRLATAALTFALLLAGAPLRAQDAGGAVDNKATAAEAGSATVQPAAPAGTKPRPNLFLDLLNELVRPRPAPVGNAVAPAPAGTATPPLVATAPAPAPAEPSPVAPSRADPTPAQPRAAATAPNPAPAPAPATVAEPPARPDVTQQPEATQSPRPKSMPEQPSPEPARAFPGATGWALLGLAAAALLAASLARLRRARRIARTKAALALAPRLDVAAGAGSLGGLAFAAPPVAIRARLEPSGASNG